MPYAPEKTPEPGRGGRKLVHEFALGSEHHERHAEYGVRTGGEYGNGQLAAFADGVEHHLGTVGAAYPVALHLLEGVGPVEPVEGIEQPAGICGHAQLPLLHLLLLHGEAAAHAEAVLDLVVRKHGAEALAPVHRGLAEIGDAVAHQDVGFLLLVSRRPLLRGDVLVAFLLYAGDELAYRAGLAGLRVIPAVEHLQESPLRPLVVGRVAGADFAVPVEREAYAVELAAVARDVLHRGHLGMLARLDGILLGGKAECIIAHGMEHVEAPEPLVAGVDVAGDVTEGVSHVKSRTAGVREHVQDVVFWLGGVLDGLVGLVGRPICLPFAFDRFEIVIHFLRFISFFPI